MLLKFISKPCAAPGKLPITQASDIVHQFMQYGVPVIKALTISLIWIDKYQIPVRLRECFCIWMLEKPVGDKYWAYFIPN